MNPDEFRIEFAFPIDKKEKFMSLVRTAERKKEITQEIEKLLDNWEAD